MKLPTYWFLFVFMFVFSSVALAENKSDENYDCDAVPINMRSSLEGYLCSGLLSVVMEGQKEYEWNVYELQKTQVAGHGEGGALFVFLSDKKKNRPVAQTKNFLFCGGWGECNATIDKTILVNNQMALILNSGVYSNQGYYMESKSLLVQQKNWVEQKLCWFSAYQGPCGESEFAFKSSLNNKNNQWLLHVEGTVCTESQTLEKVNKDVSLIYEKNKFQAPFIENKADLFCSENL